MSVITTEEDVQRAQVAVSAAQKTIEEAGTAAEWELATKRKATAVWELDRIRAKLADQEAAGKARAQRVKDRAKKTAKQRADLAREDAEYAAEIVALRRQQVRTLDKAAARNAAIEAVRADLEAEGLTIPDGADFVTGSRRNAVLLEGDIFVKVNEIDAHQYESAQVAAARLGYRRATARPAPGLALVLRNVDPVVPANLPPRPVGRKADDGVVPILVRDRWGNTVELSKLTDDDRRALALPTAG